MTQVPPRIFDPTTRRLHWLTAGLMVVVFALAFSIDQASSKGSHTALLQLHRSFGSIIWMLVLVRLAWRQRSERPEFPEDMPTLMRGAARASEYALYLLLTLQPMLGLLETNARGDRVNFFFLFQVPAVIGRDRIVARQLLEAHRAAGFLLLALIGLHAAAALYHHFWRRDDTLASMLPAAERMRGSRSPAAQSAFGNRAPRL